MEKAMTTPLSNKVEANHVQQQQQASASIMGMETELHKAAINGSFESISGIHNWREQESVTKNNILHIHVEKPLLYANIVANNKKTKQQETSSWDPTVYTEFVEQVLKDKEGYWLLWKQINSHGDTPLHVAARFGHHNAVQAFIEHAKKVYQPAAEVKRLLSVINKKKDTALHEAARAGYSKVVKLLVEANLDGSCNEPNEEGETPLYLAVERGCTKSVLSIFPTCSSSQKAYQGPCGRTALHAAVHCGGHEITQKMLENDAETLLKIQNNEGLTPLHIAVTSCAKILDMLLMKTVKSESSTVAYIQDNMGRTPLLIAALTRRRGAMTRLIASHPDCVEIVDNQGQNVLHYVAKETNLDYLDMVLKIGNLRKCMNVKDVDGNTPFHIFAAQIPDNPEIHTWISMSDLLKNNPFIDLNVFNNKNLTVGDIMRSYRPWLHKEHALEGHPFRRGRRVNIYEKANDIEKGCVIKGELNIEAIKKAAEYRLVVAALIATVSFTAGFTVPGGFDQNVGKNMGMAVFKSKPSFIVFLVADAIAFTSSTLALLFYFVLVTAYAELAIRNLSLLALAFNTISLGALMIAFLAGLSSVVSSKFLGFFIFVSLTFFYFYCRLITRNIRQWLMYGTKKVDLKGRLRAVYIAMR